MFCKVSGHIRCSLFAVRYSLFAIRYSLFAVCNSLFAVASSIKFVNASSQLSFYYAAAQAIDARQQQ